MAAATKSYAYTTLITRSSYLPGVVLLGYSLQKHNSAYPLVVLYTPNLPKATVQALQRESYYANILLCKIDPISPPNNAPTRLIAARFADTWTKLRVFSEPLFEYSRVCYLDADMLIMNKNMDEVFDAAKLSVNDLLAADHICCCNLDKDSWAPKDWIPENCAFTNLRFPEGLSNPTPVPKGNEGRATYKDLNGGMFVFQPSHSLWQEMWHYFTHCDRLSEFMFPDQDFLADFFKDRWVSLGWQYNALKTMRYWHPEMWRDEEVIALHYIVDKPWAARLTPDGKAGYKAKDGITHQWWWREYSRWEAERREQGEAELLREMLRNMAPPLGEVATCHEDLNALGSQVQAFANS